MNVRSCVRVEDMRSFSSMNSHLSPFFRVAEVIQFPTSFLSSVLKSRLSKAVILSSRMSSVPDRYRHSLEVETEYRDTRSRGDIFNAQLVI